MGTVLEVFRLLGPTACGIGFVYLTHSKKAGVNTGRGYLTERRSRYPMGTKRTSDGFQKLREASVRQQLLQFELVCYGENYGKRRKICPVSWAKTLTESVRRRAVRDLMGKIPTKEPDVTEEIYLSELVRCGECERTVPVGIEVVTIRKSGESRKVLKHGYYCRAHGLDYETRAQSLPICSHVH